MRTPGEMLVKGEEIKQRLAVVTGDVGYIKDFEAKEGRIDELKRTQLIDELTERVKELKKESEEIFTQIEEEISQFKEAKSPTEVTEVIEN